MLLLSICPLVSCVVPCENGWEVLLLLRVLQKVAKHFLLGVGKAENIRNAAI